MIHMGIFLLEKIRKKKKDSSQAAKEDKENIKSGKMCSFHETDISGYEKTYICTGNGMCMFFCISGCFIVTGFE